ncbi:MAG: stalk domain-containing protein [Clostridiales bacterium]|nr:stalk domain-containing protein [Clostridiales bacterium]
MKNRVTCVFLMVAVLLAPVALTAKPTAWAEAETIAIELDGRVLTLDQPPIIENERTLIPIRTVAESIGADVEWDPDAKTATLDRAGTSVTLTIGSNRAEVNGASVSLDAAPVIVNGRTLLPVRFVAETFSQNVEWDKQNRVVRISEDMAFAKNSNLNAWLLGVGAIIGKRNNQNLYQLGMAVRTPSNVQTQRQSLQSSWGVSDRDDLIDTIASMTYFGHSAMFNNDVELFKSLSKAEQNRVINNAEGVDKYMWPYVMALDKKWGDKSIYAWDWFRMGHLCRWGYLAGYITAEEAYELFEPVAKLLREAFSSWDEATENYLDGYAYWARIDVSGGPNEFLRRQAAYEELKEAEKRDPRGLLFDPSVWTEPVRGIENR